MSRVNAAGINGRRRRRHGLIAGVVALALLAGVVLGHRGAAPPAPPAPAAETKPLELAGADVATVARQALTRSLPLSGSVQPVDQATVKSKVSGEVLEMSVREGQQVRRGEVLARIDTRNAGANRDSSQAALEKARADAAIAKLNYGNSLKLQEQKFVSQNAVDSTRAINDAAVANVKAAEAALRLSSIALEDATVRAPFDGVVAKRGVQVGEKVSPDSAIYTLVDLSRMELDAPAPASEIPSIHVGQTAHFRVDGFADRVFTGTVWRVNPIAEAGSRSIMIYLSVPNEDSALKGGMFAQGELALDAGEAKPSIPLLALREDGGQSYVWAIHDGSLQRRGVTVGLRSPAQGQVEIRDGLQPGEQVVVPHLDGLKDGLKVSVTAAPVAAAAAQ